MTLMVYFKRAEFWHRTGMPPSSMSRRPWCRDSSTGRSQELLRPALPSSISMYWRSPRRFTLRSRPRWLASTPIRRGSAVRTLTYFHHSSGTTHQLAIDPAQPVVLAGGGISNAQLLLQPRSDGAVPVGNESDQAGKFLMEHPHFERVAELVLDEDLDPAAHAHGLWEHHPRS